MRSNQLAVVTGASSGIGAAYAGLLAKRGHDLLLVARRSDRLATLAESLRSEYGVSIECYIADLQRPADLHALERRIETEPVVLLVNNAGGGALGSTAKTGADVQERLIQLNVVALTRLSLAALTSFRKTDKGTLINIASMIALSPTAGGAAYSGTKAYVLNFTRSLQLEYDKTDIRIQAVVPGPVRTEFFTSQGLDDSLFPDSAYVTADELVDAALSGLDQGETITFPTLACTDTWQEFEAQRMLLLGGVMRGKIAGRFEGLSSP